MTRVFKLVVCLFVVFAMGCDTKDDERCADFDEILRAKAGQAADTCEDEVDCLVVEVHPGLFVAANGPVSDPEIDSVKARRVELCGDFDPDLNLYASACEEERCILEVTGAVTPPPTPDAGSPDAGEPDGGSPDLGEPDGGSCVCDSDEECGFGNLCSDGCNCSSICDVVCERGEACGKLEELRLGSDVDNCIERCDAFLDRDGEEALGLLECLAVESCEALADCL